MNILDLISGAAGGQVVGQIAKKLGISEPLALAAATALLPALTRGLQRNATSTGGLDSLLGALKTGNHQRFVDEPETLATDETIEEGNAILGHVLGSKDVSRNVAGNAAQQTGLDPAILKKMLPMLAATTMGTLSKETQGGTRLNALPGNTSADPLSALTSFLDSGEDGSGTDELLNLAKRFF